MERLKWVFELFDRFSGPAMGMTRALKNFVFGMGRGRDEAGRFTAGAKGLSFGLKELALGFGAIKIAGWGADLVKSSLGLVAFRESTITSFEMMLGSAQEAQAFFKKGIDFARLTPFEPQEVIRSFKQLLAAGFTKEEVPVAFQAIGDVVALSGMDAAEAFGRMSLAFGQIQGKGKLMTQELNQILEVSSQAGVTRFGIFEAIAKNMKVTAKEVPDLMEKGLVSSSMAIYSVLEAVKNRMGGELGKGMQRQSETLAGQWSTLKGLAAEFFLTIDQSKLPGVEMLKNVMQRLTTLFDTNTATGKRMQGVLSGAFNAIGSVVLTVMDALEHMGEVISPLWTELNVLFKDSGMEWLNIRNVLGFVVVVLGSVVEAVMMAIKGWKLLWNEMFVPLGDVVKWYYDIAVNVVEGFVNGLKWAKGKLVGAVGEMGSNVVNGFKAMLGIHSPSRVFHEMGMYSGEGFNQGLEKSLQGTANIPGLNMSDPAFGRAGASRARGPISISINVDATGQSDADGIARKIRDVVVTELATVFESVAIEAGAA